MNARVFPTDQIGKKRWVISALAPSVISRISFSRHVLTAMMSTEVLVLTQYGADTPCRRIIRIFRRETFSKSLYLGCAPGIPPTQRRSETDRFQKYDRRT